MESRQVAENTIVRSEISQYRLKNGDQPKIDLSLEIFNLETRDNFQGQNDLLLDSKNQHNFMDEKKVSLFKVLQKMEEYICVLTIVFIF